MTSEHLCMPRPNHYKFDVRVHQSQECFTVITTGMSEPVKVFYCPYCGKEWHQVKESGGGDVDDDLHHSNHGVYEDVRLPHRDTTTDKETDTDRLQEES